jgi:ADP-ribose pyrophosphatase
MSDSPFELVDSKLIYANGWINVREDQVIRPSGNRGVFGVVTMREGVTVLPITDNDEVFLAQEYKYAIGGQSVEIMSGGIEDGEKPLAAAKRELEEELGLAADRWQYLGYVDPFTTVVNSRNHMFLARGLMQSGALNDPDEMISTRLVPREKAIQMVMNGEITHAASCVILLKSAHFPSGLTTHEAS